jgi:hypothetical protein
VAFNVEKPFLKKRAADARDYVSGHQPRESNQIKEVFI